MKLRVYVVDDSAISRECLRDVLEAGGTIEVVGEAGDASVALREIPALAPDVVTMDLHMPAMGGLEAIERIMASSPVPILVVTERPTSAGTDVVDNPQPLENSRHRPDQSRLTKPIASATQGLPPAHEGEAVQVSGYTSR